MFTFAKGAATDGLELWQFLAVCAAVYVTGLAIRASRRR